MEDRHTAAVCDVAAPDGAGLSHSPLGIRLAGVDRKSVFGWLFMSYVLQSVRELLISPIGYSTRAQAAHVIPP
jgi:dipeptide/tripeptide permease